MKLSFEAPQSVYEELLLNDEPLEVLHLLWALDAWNARRNPYFLDYVLVSCETAQLTVGPLLLAELTRAASLRVRGLSTGTPEAVQKELQTFDQLTRMTTLIRGGMGKTEAAAEAADGKKLSTLETYYTQRVRNTGLERTIFSILDELDNH